MTPQKNSQTLFKGHSPQSGFSLVEVVLAVGVVAFAFVAVLGLLPAGMTQFRQAIDTSTCAQIAQRVIYDAEQSDFDVLTDKDNVPQVGGKPTSYYSFRAPRIASPALRYFDEQGNEVLFTTTPSAANLAQKQVIYHVNTRIIVSTDVPALGYTGTNTDLATVTVEVAYNPGNQVLTFTGGSTDPSQIRRNLFVLRPNIPVKTYSAQVGRNQ